MHKALSSEAFTGLPVSDRINRRKPLYSAGTAVAEHEYDSNYNRVTYHPNKFAAAAPKYHIFRYCFHHHIAQGYRAEKSYHRTNNSDHKILDNVESANAAIVDTDRFHYTYLTDFLTDRKANREPQHHKCCYHQDNAYHHNNISRYHIIEVDVFHILSCADSPDVIVLGQLPYAVSI